MTKRLLIFMTILVIALTFDIVQELQQHEMGGVGYKIGNVTDYKFIKSFNRSKLYQIQCKELDDGRPVQLLELVGSHYEVGYAYGALLGPQIVETYHTFLEHGFSKKWEIFFLQNFLSWQYDQYVEKQIPFSFKEQLRGLQQGGSNEHNIHNLRTIFQQTLVISSYPGDFTSDIAYALLDQFLRDQLHIKNQAILNIVQDRLFQCVKLIKNFFNKKRIHCSFFAIWGQRTEGGKLMTMRNLDWQANTGMNKYKTLFIWKIDDTIPHATLGFPAILGALTGISKAGITVHEAGLDSLRQTQLGFQWSLRLRYILMNAQNLQEAKQIWHETNNTLGMNHMVASASDLATNQPAFVVETMRNYTAWFVDHDEREDGTIFTDPKTNQKYRAGFAMKQAVFRTNHAYDPTINKYRTFLPSITTSTMQRYFTLKNGLQYYEDEGMKMSEQHAVNVTAATAHKGGHNPLKCPGPGDNGTNVISAMFVPASQSMYMAFEYGSGSEYKTACCGVYIHIDLRRWFD